MSGVDESPAQRFIRSINESVERMRVDMETVGPRLTRQWREAIEAAARSRDKSDNP